MAFDIALEVLVPVTALVGLALASLRWGWDSRDGSERRPRPGF